MKDTTRARRVLAYQKYTIKHHGKTKDEVLIEKLHQKLDEVIDNRNEGMDTGDASVLWRLSELVSKYKDLQLEKEKWYG
jgi:hypothetical protein